MFSKNYFKLLLFLGLVHELIINPKRGQAKNMLISATGIGLICAQLYFKSDLQYIFSFIETCIVAPPELLILYFFLLQLTPSLAENLTASAFSFKLLIDYYALTYQSILSTPKNQFNLLISIKLLADTLVNSFFKIFMMEMIKNLSSQKSHLNILRSLDLKDILKDIIINYQNKNYEYICYSNIFAPLENRKNILFSKIADQLQDAGSKIVSTIESKKEAIKTTCYN